MAHQRVGDRLAGFVAVAEAPAKNLHAVAGRAELVFAARHPRQYVAADSEISVSGFTCSDAERRACQIRMRAEKKAGALDKVREKAKASGTNQHQERFRDGTSPPTLRDLGVSKRQVHDWRKLDDAPRSVLLCRGFAPPATI